ncbi:peptidoglycan DD-metalloendopeptidase family protein [Streptomyces sp. NPDC059176]|uniref:M23 family metallopeptidase n=1 Tax=unclassified Streptomyces TaxID=2593676 RepID=UPI0036822DB7
MPGRGKHRRPRTSPFSRGFVAAGTGGVVIALPLIGAAGAHAAAKSAPTAERTAAVARQAAAPQVVKTPAAPKTYTVVAGDYLSKIARDQHVRGGWKKLYADNRAAVGEDPSLIHPGLKLSIGARAKAAPSAQPSAKSAAKAKAPAKSQKPAVAADRASRSDARPAVAPAPAANALKISAAGYTLPVNSPLGTAYKTSGPMWSSGYHTGVDFVASAGTSVKAVGPGSVVSAGWAGAYGNQVVIKHDDGTYSQYAHLSALSVSAGQGVKGGDQVGLSGSTGNTTGPHLHFEIRTTPNYGSDIDPLAYLRQHGVAI